MTSNTHHSSIRVLVDTDILRHEGRQCTPLSTSGQLVTTRNSFWLTTGPYRRMKCRLWWLSTLLSEAKFAQPSARDVTDGRRAICLINYARRVGPFSHRTVTWLPSRHPPRQPSTNLQPPLQQRSHPPPSYQYSHAVSCPWNIHFSVLLILVMQYVTCYIWQPAYPLYTTNKL